MAITGSAPAITSTEKRTSRAASSRSNSSTPPHSWGGGGEAAGGAAGKVGARAAGKGLAARRPDQLPQRFLRSPPELASQNKSHQPTPPPGREVEVSIEPDQSAAPCRLGQGHPLEVGHA